MKKAKMEKEKKMIRSECKYWQEYCEICGIYGNNYCIKKCKDYYNVCEEINNEAKREYEDKESDKKE